MPKIPGRNEQNGGEFTLDPDNARLHGDRSKEVIAESLREYGAGRSILVDADGIVRAGNGTYEQAVDLGIPVRVVETDGSELIAVKRTDLRGIKAIGLAIADNRTAEESEWNHEVASRLTALVIENGLAAPGWTAEEIAAFRASDEFAPPAEFPAVDEDIEIEHVCPRCGYQFSGGKTAPAGGG